MKKDAYLNILIVVGVAALIFFFFSGNLELFAAANYGSVTRTAPTSISPGQTFTVTYSTVITNPVRYVAAVEETITGGCSPTSKKLLFINEQGTGESQAVTYTAPSSGTCTFTGTYEFANGISMALPTISIPVVVCKTDADTNCDNSISTAELIAYGQKWLNGQITTTKLMEAANSWISQ